MVDLEVRWTGKYGGQWIGGAFGYYKPSEKEVNNLATHNFVPDSSIGISICTKCKVRVYGAAAAFNVDPCNIDPCNIDPCNIP